MAVSKAVRRLLRVRELEETLHRRELESVQSELAQLELALRAAGERRLAGWHLVASGVQSEDLCDRLAGMGEVQAGSLFGAVVKQRIHQSTLVAEEMRTALLNKRVEHKQAEMLIKAAEAREAIETDRRTQQSLDDWYLTRIPGERPEKNGEEKEFSK
jgi:hypothetical protein